MRVKIEETGLNTYPDVLVIYGQSQFIDTTRDTVSDPIVIIEALSLSAERYDSGMKFQHYRAIETLQDHLLLAQDKQYIEHYSCREGGNGFYVRRLEVIQIS